MKVDAYKGVCTIIGGVVINIIAGTLISLGNLNVYLMSYLKEFNHKISLGDSFFLIPLGLFTSSCLITGGAFLETKINSRIVLTIGCVAIVGANFVLWASKYLVLDYFCIIFYGAGIGINYIIAIRNCLNYFPKKHGLVTGIILSGSGISSACWTIIGDKIMNPTNENPIIEEGNDNFYRYEIAKNFQLYQLVIMSTIVVLSIIGIILTFPYSPKQEERISQASGDRLVTIGPNGEPLRQTAAPPQTVFDEASENETFLSALGSKGFLLFFLMALLSSFFLFVAINSYQQFAFAHSVTFDKILVSSGIFLILGVLSILWGFLFDKIGFKKLFYILNAVELAIGACFYYSISVPFIFLILIFLTGGLLGGLYVILLPFVYKLCGIENGSAIYGIVHIAYGISGILGALFMFTIRYGLDETSKFPYLSVYSAGAFFCVVSSLIAFCFSENKKVYE